MKKVPRLEVKIKKSPW